METLRHFLKDESGQALIEYALLMLVVVSVVGFMKTSLKELTVKLWVFFAKRIAAPCATCDAGTEFDL
jgi:Flp pilus assembly pilin Flp